MAIDITNLTAAELLAILEPEQLFSGDCAVAKNELRKLASLWHPDHHRDPMANQIFAHIQVLYRATLEKLASGIWDVPGMLSLQASDGRKFELRHVRKHRLEIGEMYVGHTALGFVVPMEFADLVTRAANSVSRLTYRDETMRDEFSRYVPEAPFAAHFETRDAVVVILRKAPDLLLLRDVLDHFGNAIDAHHVAWIISSLLNLACYCNYARVAHNGISPESVFISPRAHSVALLGGWWYAVRVGERMAAAPRHTVEHGPSDLAISKRACIRTDLELIRTLGRELLGDIGGSRLTNMKTVPPAMARWLRMPGSDDPVADYQEWQTQVLQDSFGVRRFVERALTASDIYQHEYQH